MDSNERVLLLTVNRNETKALFTAFRELAQEAPVNLRVEGHLYAKLGALSGVPVFHALTGMGSGGVGAAQQSVDKAIRALRPTMIIAVGVAFGIDAEKQSIGDILVSRQINLYESQRVGEKSSPSRGDQPRAATRLLDLLERADQTTWEGAKVTFGLVLSGEKLVDNQTFRDALLKEHPSAIGGEMEGAGIYVACAEHNVHWVVVKGICDFADGDKATGKTEKQIKAATNAADFVLHSLSMAFSAEHFPAAGSEAAISPGNPLPAGAGHVNREVSELLTIANAALLDYEMLLHDYLRIMLNKGGLRKGSETQRLALDTEFLRCIRRLELHVPKEYFSVLQRLRRIMSNSFQSPADIYYMLLDTMKKFPRAPIDMAGKMFDDLKKCHTDMARLCLAGTMERSAYVSVMNEHSLDEGACSTHEAALRDVAMACVLESEYFSSETRLEKLEAYKRSLDVESSEIT